MENSTDSMLGGFRILSRIKAGSGSQGTVYKAVCESDEYEKCPRGTIVALKSMPAAAEREGAFEKLTRNVEELSRLHHPNVVRYLGCFVAQVAFTDRHVVIQEYLEGETLAAKLAAAPAGLDADVALHVVKGMLEGLAAAARRGIIHRDVKPANVFICEDGTAKMIDFEVSRQTSGTSFTSSSGNLVGSFDYMAPEFTDSGFSGDETSDVFSAGVVMHETLTGSIPYTRSDATQRSKASFAFFSRWLRDATGSFAKDGCRISYRVERVLSHVKDVLVKALNPDRSRRFATFAAFADALGGVRFRELKDGERRYQILQLVGKGGFGEVFKMRTEDGKVVAVKHLLKFDYAARFFREAKIMAEFRDPCFVQFLDFFTIDRPGAKEAFLVMDFLPGMPGSSLRDAIRASAGSGVDFREAMVAFIRYAHGLGVLHSRGVYHRDIKPSNLYFPVDHPEKAAIMDFGIARDENGTRTTGQVPGTLDYMPPEVVVGGSRGGAGMDIYALGLCLYEALTGKKGFPRLPSGSAAFAQFFKRAREKARPTFDDERLTSRPALLKLLVWMTEPDCDARLSDAARVEAALQNILDGKEDALLQGEYAAGPSTSASTAASFASAAIDETTTRHPSVATLTSEENRALAPLGNVADDVTEDDAPTGRTVFMKLASGSSTPISFPPPPPASEKEVERSGEAEAPRVPSAPPEKTVESTGESSAPTPPPEKTAESSDGASGSGTPSAPPSPRRRRRRGRRFPWLRLIVMGGYLASLVLMAAAGYIFGEPVCRWVSRLTAPRREAVVNRENMAVSEGLGLGVENLYGDDFASLAEADALRDRWLEARKPPASSPDEYARLVNLLAEKRKQRIARDKLNASHSQFDIDARVVVEAYRLEGVAAGDKRRSEWLSTWGASAAERVEEAKSLFDAAREERQRSDEARALAPKAAEEATEIVKSYEADGSKDLDSNAEAWRSRWRAQLLPEDFKKLAAVVEKAQKAAKERRLQKKREQTAKAVMAECRGMIDMLTPVESRMGRLVEAEMYLHSEVQNGRIDDANAARLEAEIKNRRQWTVFEIENRSDLDLTIDGDILKNGETRLFVYTNAPPEDLQAAHVGYEPLALGVQTNGRRLKLLPEHFAVLRVAVRVGHLADGVICRVDGIMVRGEIVRLMPGSHECTYSRADYMDQSFPFRVEPGEPTALPQPCEWKESDGLGSLISAESAMESGDWNLAESILSSVFVSGPDGVRRKRALADRIDRHRKFLKRVDMAAAAYRDANWMDAVEQYYRLVSDGYALTEEDRARISTSANNVKLSLNLKRHSVGRSGSDMTAEKVEQELRRLSDMMKTMKVDYEEDSEEP